MTAPGRFRANLGYNIAGALIPIVSAFVTVPIYIQHVGAARYGIIAIAWLLLGYFGFLDFGLSRATANTLSRMAHEPPAVRSPVIVTAIVMNLGLGLAGGLVMLLGGQLLLSHVFSIPDALRAETLAAFPWTAAMLPLGMLSGVATGILESRERFLAANLLTSTGNVVGQVLPLLVAILVSPTLPYVIPAMLLARALTVAATFAVAFRLEWPVRLLDFDRAWVRRLFGYGAWVSVSSLISPLLDGLDQMLIGAMLGPAAIAHYAVPMNLALRSQVAAVALARTLFPRLSRATPEEARTLALHSSVGLAYGFGAVCGPAILVSDAFLRLWVGTEFAAYAAPVAIVLLAGAWINGVAFVPYSLIQGQGRPDITAKVHMVEIVPFIAVLWLMMRWFGLPGAALAWTLRVSADCVALLVLSRMPVRSFWRFLPALGLIVACTGIAVGGVAQPVLAGCIAGLLFVATGLAVEPSLRAAAAPLLAWRRPRRRSVPPARPLERPAPEGRP